MSAIWIAACCLLAAGEESGSAPPTAEQLRFFESSVRPVLALHCEKCHGAKKQFNGLRLDSAGPEKGAGLIINNEA